MLDRLPWLRGRSPGAIAAALIVLGAAAGIAAKEADHAQARWVSDLANYPGTWIFLLAVMARLAPAATHAAMRSAGFFAAMSLAYYAWSAFAMGIEPGRYVYVWTALSVTLVPVLAILVHRATLRRGAAPGLVLAAAAAAVLADGAVRQLWLRYALDALPPGFPLHPVQAVLNVVFAVTIVAALPRHPETRMWALALALPLTIPADLVIDRAYGALLA